ncbi:MAG: hypothetical protein R3305_09625 [Gammaproteobacteria bacterium]|nr:hypothetical protein [Gammaproteobacteria bacterium]
MSEYTKIATSIGDQYLDALAETQETFLKAWAPATEWASKVKVPQAPGFAADFPTLAEITEANFAFTSKLLKQQKKFAEKLFANYTPATSE